MLPLGCLPLAGLVGGRICFALLAANYKAQGNNIFNHLAEANKEELYRLAPMLAFGFMPQAINVARSALQGIPYRLMQPRQRP